MLFKTKMLQDNDFLKKGHRPPLSSFRECFASIFRIHTETVRRKGKGFPEIICTFVMFVSLGKHMDPSPGSVCVPWALPVFYDKTHCRNWPPGKGRKYFYINPGLVNIYFQAVFLAFFSGAIVCLGLSFTYHTVCCHENRFIGGYNKWKIWFSE